MSSVLIEHTWNIPPNGDIAVLHEVAIDRVRNHEYRSAAQRQLSLQESEPRSPPLARHRAQRVQLQHLRHERLPGLRHREVCAEIAPRRRESRGLQVRNRNCTTHVL